MAKYPIKLRLKNTPPSNKFASIHQLLADSPNSICHSCFPHYFLRIPEILGFLNIDWGKISENLGIEINKDNFCELEFCLNKIIYSDKSEQFSKNFGIKTINLYDLGLTSVNQITDSDLVVDKDNFAFSYFDLKRLSKDSPHPYLGVGEHGKKMIGALVTEALLNGPTRLSDDVSEKKMTIYEYLERDMYHSFRTDSSLSIISDNVQEIDDPLLLESIFEQAISHDFYTNSLISLYRDRQDHLDYTVALLYYILAIIDDFNFGERYLDCLINNYFREPVETTDSSTNNKYCSFLRNYIYFLSDVKENYNTEKCQYVCIIIVKILQYRFAQIQEGEDLFKVLKPYVRSNFIQEFYWSVILDRVNYLHAQQTGKISLINISIDNIFSNADFDQYYYTLMVYLHTKYMDLPSRENGNISRFLNHYKPVENYNYLDLIQYFSDMAKHVELNNRLKHLKRRFQTMIRRYYLKEDYITINRNGLVVD